MALVFWLVLTSAGIIAALTMRGGEAGPSPAGSHAGGESTAIGVSIEDEVFLEVASQVPGFGGAYIDAETGTLRIWLKTPTQETAELAREALAQALDRNLAYRAAVPLQATYTFPQLHQWRDRMTDVLAIDGVVLTDIDEARNQLTVGVENLDEQGPLVEAELARLRIPRRAVNVEEMAPIGLD